MTRRVRAFLGAAAGGLALLATLPLGVAAARPASAGPSAAAAETDTVYVTRTDASGRLTVTIYDPAEGVSPDQLRARLRAAGAGTVLARGARPPAAQPRTPAVAAACLSYGSARQWCGHLWNYNGFNDPQVYFLDHTSAAWPVTSAVVNWNLAIGIDSWYRWYTLGCPGGGRHCVNVYNGRYGLTGWLGLTTWSPGTQGPVTVKLNDSYPLSANEHRTIACHETGHALALDHNTSTSSCLYSGRYISLVPNSSDYALLPRMYPRPGT